MKIHYYSKGFCREILNGNSFPADASFKPNKQFEEEVG
jgi:hypothetical protein